MAAFLAGRYLISRRRSPAGRVWWGAGGQEREWDEGAMRCSWSRAGLVLDQQAASLGAGRHAGRQAGRVGQRAGWPRRARTREVRDLAVLQLGRGQHRLLGGPAGGTCSVCGRGEASARQAGGRAGGSPQRARRTTAALPRTKNFRRSSRASEGRQSGGSATGPPARRGRAPVVDKGVHAAGERDHVVHGAVSLEDALEHRARRARAQVADPQVARGLGGLRGAGRGTEGRDARVG